MAVQDDVTTARDALRSLERAVSAVTGHYGDVVDVRRLRQDVDRVAQDLDLLCGHPVQPVATRMEIIDDKPYPQDFWMDAEDEGLGGGR